MAPHDLPAQAQLPIKTQFRETKILVFAQLWGKQGAEVSETWGWKTGAAVTLPICIKHSDPALPANPLHACQHSYHSGTKEPPLTDWTIRKILYRHTHRDRSNWLISWITLQSDGSDERNLQALLESYRLLSEFTAVLNVLEGGSPLGAGFHGGLRHHGGL